MLLNIHNEESLRIRNKKFSSEWPFKSMSVLKNLPEHGNEPTSLLLGSEMNFILIIGNIFQTNLTPIFTTG
jgi:hypothetical protein